MRINPKALSAIGAAGVSLLLALGFTASWEGKTNHAIRPVPSDPWTICHGHTRGVKEGDTATEAQCQEWLREDLIEAALIVDACIAAPEWAPLTRERHAALTDFALNVGPGRKGVKDGLCVLKNGNTPYIRRMAALGNWPQVCAGFRQWVRAGGVFYQGLDNRRKAEQNLCLSSYIIAAE